MLRVIGRNKEREGEREGGRGSREREYGGRNGEWEGGRDERREGVREGEGEKNGLAAIERDEEQNSLPTNL